MKEFRRPSGQGAGRNSGERQEFSSRPSFDRKPGYNKYQGERSNVRPEGQVKHRAVCADCGNSCEVPFRPNGMKPVFCKDCFGQKKGAPTNSAPASNNFAKKEFASAPQSAAPVRDSRIDELQSQMDAMHSKIDRLVRMMESSMPAPKYVAPVAAKPAAAQAQASAKKETKPEPAKAKNPEIKKAAAKPVAKKAAAPAKKAAVVVAKKPAAKKKK